jgi:hypothetical protein
MKTTMVRTQIQLTPSQARALRDAAAREGRSVADLIRELVDAHVASTPGPSRGEVRRRAIAAAGRFRSGRGDLGTRHDRHLEDALRP